MTDAVPSEVVFQLMRGYIQSSTSDDREASGAALWDLTISLEAARLLVENHFLPVLAAVLSQAANPREQQVATGILANLCSHSSLRRAIVQGNSVGQQVLSLLFTSQDPDVLIEVLRLAAVALREQQSIETSGSLLLSTLASSEATERVALFLEQSLAAPLLLRALDFFRVLCCMTDHVSELTRVQLVRACIQIMQTMTDFMACEEIRPDFSGLDCLLDLLRTLWDTQHFDLEQQQAICTELLTLIQPFEHKASTQSLALRLLGDMSATCFSSSNSASIDTAVCRVMQAIPSEQSLPITDEQIQSAALDYAAVDTILRALAAAASEQPLWQCEEAPANMAKGAGKIVVLCRTVAAEAQGAMVDTGTVLEFFSQAEQLLTGMCGVLTSNATQCAEIQIALTEVQQLQKQCVT